MNCQVKDELVSQLSVLIWFTGTENAPKCNNNVRTYTPRSSTIGRRDTKANRAQLQDRFRSVTSDWLGKRISAEFDSETVPFPMISNYACFDRDK
ncbi:MAG: hypothetical protein DMG34_14615 [Acidobacteria bacterium]|nr:MAG: hypothetical protein DMG34_14615 [Acidobacteriota bacterium]